MVSTLKERRLIIALLALFSFVLCVAVASADVVDITEMLDDALATHSDIHENSAGLISLLVLSWAVLLCFAKMNADILAAIGIDSRVRPFICGIPGSGKVALVSVQKFNN